MMQSARRSRHAIIAMGSLATVLMLMAMALVAPSGARAGGTIQGIKAHNVPGGTYGCNDTEWHFVINQVDIAANAPATIHVEWLNGNSEDIPLDAGSGSPVASYTTTSNLDSTVTVADAVIYADWSGQFNLSHGPCSAEQATETPIEVATETPPAEVATETPEVTATEVASETATLPIESETEVPVTKTPTTAPAAATATIPVGGAEELPNTGAGPDQSGVSGLLAAALLTIALAAIGLALRRRSFRMRG